MRGPVVVDTGVFGAELRSTSPLADLYRPFLAGRQIVVSFQTVAELRYGARRRGWGTKLIGLLSAMIDTTEVVWSGAGLVETYAELRTACVTSGHPLGQAHHEADRWIAATACRLGVPLVTHDRIFRDARGLEVLTRLR